MKFATFALAAIVSAEEKKVPPRHPLERLNRLNEFSAEILNAWFTFLPSKDAWVAKFATNAGRMQRNFERGSQKCGFYDDSQLPHGGPERKRRDAEDENVERYDRDDPTKGVKQITTGYSKWAQRYIGACSGQRTSQFQVNRMSRWNTKLQDHLSNQ